MSLKYTDITKEAFTATLSRYATLVPPALHDLDTARYDTIPAALHERKAQKNDAYLEKSEVERLVEWKLKHGTFRPKLLQLVHSNPSELVAETTRAAFQKGTSAEDVKAAVKLLTALKGIGPATASLILSVHRGGEVPFFSDELFRWVMWDEKGVGKGWKRGIKYDLKEYVLLFERVGELRKRLDVRAVECEKVAWVLGKEGVDFDGDAGWVEEKDVAEKGIEGGPEQKEIEGDKPGRKNRKNVESVETKKAVKRGTKRKAGEEKPVPEGSRRSGRRKKDVFYGEN